MTALDWDKAARTAKVGPKHRPRRQPAPTRKQLTYLKELRKKAGIAGEPQPTTRAEASLEIDRLKLGIPTTNQRHEAIEQSVRRRAAAL